MGDKPETLITDGVRLDGRKPKDMRALKIVAGFLENADGSCYLECGSTKVVAAVYGPRQVHPRHATLFDRALVRCKYDMAAFSTDGNRKRPGPDRRSREISKVSSEALSSVVFTEAYPRTAIDVFIEIIQADASTRVNGLTAASVALADAGIPMRDMLVALSFGKIYGTQDGKPAEVVAVDMDKPEDNWGLADVALAYMPNLERFVLCQMDGRLTHDEFRDGLEMIKKPAQELYKLQKEALRKKYKG